MSNGSRILTTHVGSLPRPQDVVDVVFGEDRGEDVDRDRYDRVIRDAVADRVRHQAEAGHRRRQRRRDEQDRLRHLHPPPVERLRGRRRPARNARRPRRVPALSRPPRQGGREREVPAPDLPRPDHLRAPRVVAARPREFESRDRRPARRRCLHERAVARDHRLVSAQRVLRDARRVPRGDRRSDEARVRGHRRVRRAAADRRARSRDGPPHHVPRPLRRGVRRERPAAHRGDQPRASRRAGRSGASAHLLGELRGPASSRHRPRRRSST